MNNGEGVPKPDELAALRVLDEIEKNPRISQREISRRVGISLGQANLLIRRMARKAWIKIKSVPGQRLFYALTPRGLTEKFRKARDFVRLALRHTSGLKESMIRRIRETGIEKPVVAVHEPGELAGLVAEAVHEAGGMYAANGAGARIVLAFAKSPRPKWDPVKVIVIDFS